MAAILAVLVAIFLLLWDAHPAVRIRAVPMVAAVLVAAAVLGTAGATLLWELS